MADDKLQTVLQLMYFDSTVDPHSLDIGLITQIGVEIKERLVTEPKPRP